MMPSLPLRFPLCLLIAGALFGTPCPAQQSPGQNPAPPPQNPRSAQQPSSSSRVPNLNPTEGPSPALPTPSPAPRTTRQKGPLLLEPAGPSLETSEALFDLGVTLNACGYNDGLDESDPVRKAVRDEVTQATQASPAALDDRDKLCFFIDRHRLEDPAHNLAQYVSLALFLTPPPQLALAVEEQDLPPDASGVAEILPLLNTYADAIDLHEIWDHNRPAYERLTSQLHLPLAQMIQSTDYYLKMPGSNYGDRHFLVLIEPMFSPEETNARVYGEDYIVVASPKNGRIYMDLVRHAYLHYEIEPLLYARAPSLDRMQPILRAVEDAPLDFEFKSDIVPLVIECLIRAIEARTMDTGVADVKVPPNLSHSEAQPYERARALAEQKSEAIRQQSVNHSMTQGFVLTLYFYNQLRAFEREPESLSEAIGPMVYGMDIGVEVHRARDITFDAQGEGDIMTRAPQRPPQPTGLDLAEMKLIKGDIAGATALAQRALEDHSGDAGQADFILARADLMSGKIDDAQAAFHSALTASHDSRTLAWSHIYLGRIFDVEEQRDQALAEYKAALTVRDGQPDTKEAAEAGLKAPFTLPHQAENSGDDGSDHPPQPPPGPSPQPHLR